MGRRHGVDMSEQPMPSRRQFIRLVLEKKREVNLELAGALVDCDPILETKGPHLADEPCPSGDHLITDTVKSL